MQLHFAVHIIYDFERNGTGGGTPRVHECDVAALNRSTTLSSLRGSALRTRGNLILSFRPEGEISLFYSVIPNNSERVRNHPTSVIPNNFEQVRNWTPFPHPASVYPVPLKTCFFSIKH